MPGLLTFGFLNVLFYKSVVIGTVIILNPADLFAYEANRVCVS